MLAALAAIGYYEHKHPGKMLDTMKGKGMRGFGGPSPLDHPLSNTELDAMAEKLNIPNYLGAVPDDQLQIRPGCCGIVNYQSTGEPGSHWVGWWFDDYDDFEMLYVFDSLGFPPDDVVERAAKKYATQVVFTDEPVQSSHSSVCGLYALLFCYAMQLTTDKNRDHPHQGKPAKSYQDFIEVWSENLEQNDTLLLKKMDALLQ